MAKTQMYKVVNTNILVRTEWLDGFTTYKSNTLVFQIFKLNLIYYL